MQTTPLTLENTPPQRHFNIWSVIYALILTSATSFAIFEWAHAMDVYEKWILIGCAPALWLIAAWWPTLRLLSVGVGITCIWGIALYSRTNDQFGADLMAAEQVFALKYFLSSQSAILWMSVLFFMSTLFYWMGLLGPSPTPGQRGTAYTLGSRLAWAAVFMALVGSCMRWYESHQIAPDIGHIPVSNLYEVFILFCWLTALFYLYYEQHYQTPAMGPFVMLVISAAVGFLLWYTLVREAHQIQPLVPALQSWWMKLHVPANFIGYGTFAISAMVAFAYLVKQQAQQRRWYTLLPLWLMGVVLCFEPLVFRQTATTSSTYWAIYFGLSALLVAGILALRQRIGPRLPSFEVLDDVMYKAIAIGFAFFTIATILGAFWAAEAWGGYWSWDPKETWALIVWLNYAAWLHMRLMKGLRGTFAAWWALVGLVITTFAFLGVNMFLSGLHSYGEL